LYLQVQHTFHV